MTNSPLPASAYDMDPVIIANRKRAADIIDGDQPISVATPPGPSDQQAGVGDIGRPNAGSPYTALTSSLSGTGNR